MNLKQKNGAQDYILDYLKKTQICGVEKEESNSITNQKILLNEFICENQDIQIYDFYIDDGFTGTDFNRPAFQKMLEDIKLGFINCVIVKDLSRLGRNYIEVRKFTRAVFPTF